MSRHQLRRGGRPSFKSGETDDLAACVQVAHRSATSQGSAGTTVGRPAEVPSAAGSGAKRDA